MATKQQQQNQEKCHRLLNQFNREVQDLIEGCENAEGLYKWLRELKADADSAEMSDGFEDYEPSHRDSQDIACDMLDCWLNTFKPAEVPDRLAHFVRFTVTRVFPECGNVGSSDMAQVYRFLSILRDELPVWFNDLEPAMFLEEIPAE